MCLQEQTHAGKGSQRNLVDKAQSCHNFPCYWFVDRHCYPVPFQICAQVSHPKLGTGHDASWSFHSQIGRRAERTSSIVMRVCLRVGPAIGRQCGRIGTGACSTLYFGMGTLTYANVSKDCMMPVPAKRMDPHFRVPGGVVVPRRF